MTNEEKVQHWVNLSDEDLSAEATLLQGGYYFWSITAMDKTDDIIAKVRKYKALVMDSFPMKVEKVYLFGSYAKGTPRKDSDIDVALVVSHFEGNFFKVIPPLWKLTREVDFRIEPVVVARDTDYAGFLNEIQRTGIEIDS